MTEYARWVHRFADFGSALTHLKSAVELARRRPLSELEEQGLIQGFEYTHELAWKTLKDFFESAGEKKIGNSTAATRIALRAGVIADGVVWMSMIGDRNLTSHTYNEKNARKIATAIRDNYVGEFQFLHDKLEKLKKGGAQ
ncbi:MAG: nucleotidyltransferase substrate binding protein [Gammaproteobacteria bacterium]